MRWSAASIAALEAARRQGTPLAQLARSHGVSRATLATLLHRARARRAYGLPWDNLYRHRPGHTAGMTAPVHDRD